MGHPNRGGDCRAIHVHQRVTCVSSWQVFASCGVPLIYSVGGELADFDVRHLFASVTFSPPLLTRPGGGFS